MIKGPEGEHNPSVNKSEKLSIDAALTQTVEEIRRGQITNYKNAIARMRELTQYEGEWNDIHIDACINAVIDKKSL